MTTVFRARPDRVFFPAAGFMKSDAIAWYEGVADVLLPHLRNVPVSFKRYPDTVNGESFWEKDAPSFTPKWVKTVAVPRRGGEGDIHYIVISDRKTLRWIADVGGIEIHPFLHRARKLEHATSVVFDLDPGEGATIVECCEVALDLRRALASLRLESFAKVSGSKGLQVYVPLNGTASHDTTESFARFIADELARAKPRLIVSKMAKNLRAGRVFIDWSQNADYKTMVAVYSLRARREVPYVSMPVRWEEVEKAKNLDFTPEQALRRVQKIGDLFAPVLKLRQKLLPSVREARGLTPGSRAKARSPHLPKPDSQSGRRLFVMPPGGDEIWLEMRGKFKRWILRPDREGGRRLIAVPAGEFKIDDAYYRGEADVRDSGAYEVIDGSYQRNRFDLFFSGKTLEGEWVLEKLGDERHQSWSFTPIR
jgi:bifunctional non-homologous end joining protein LigD